MSSSGYSADDIFDVFKDAAVTPLRRVMQGDNDIEEISPSQIINDVGVLNWLRT
jgi:hypothetical protein